MNAAATSRQVDVTTIAARRRALAQAFRAAGLDSPALDARLLIGHALGLDHAELAAAAERALAPEEIASIDRLAARRLAREPVARIIGMKEFWGLPLAVTPAVLVPRPESETVVEAALAALGSRAARMRALRIADLGTGSGALLLALLTELPLAYGVGTDRDPRALATARDNAERLGLGGRAGFVVGDYGTALAGGFDLVIANPPYVRTGDIESLAPEVRDFDPLCALDGGRDGLAAYRAIAADARRLLARSAPLLVEVGAGQAGEVADLLQCAALRVESVARDIGGTARAVTARRAV
ncbi:MAG: peptide chain release factor N(5)-glutamine methyltransferase [Rhodoplanes sp.]